MSDRIARIAPAELLGIALAAARFPRSVPAGAAVDAFDLERIGHRFPGFLAARLPEFAGLAAARGPGARLGPALLAWAARRGAAPAAGLAPELLARRLGVALEAGALAAVALPGFAELRRGDIPGLGALDAPGPGAPPLSRLFRMLMLGIRMRRPDMLDTIDGSAGAVLDWVIVFGLAEYELWPLLPPADRKLLLAGGADQPPLFLRAVRRFREDLRRVDAHTLRGWFAGHATREYGIRLQPSPRPVPAPGRLTVIGPWRHVLGIADDCYGAARALLERGTAFELVDTRPARWIETDPDKRAALGHLAVAAPAGERAFFCDTLFQATAWALGHWPAFVAFRRRDLFTPWELPGLPSGWRQALGLFDTVLTPSCFVQAALTVGAGATRVLHVTSSVELAPRPRAASRLLLRRRVVLPARDPVLLTVFDFASWLGRKNPTAVIEAFALLRRAHPRAVLVVKTTRGRWARGSARRLAARLRGQPGVVWLDGPWPNAALEALIARADALVSLHRAEGFGRNIAKALLLGTRVVVTDWSGNADFRSEPGYHGVPVRLRRITDRDYVLGDGQCWAEPDRRGAVRAMRAALSRPPLPPRARTACRFSRARLAHRLGRVLDL